LLTACGPSQDQISTMTASAWTPTHQPTATSDPTATSTPVPYDLTVSVLDTAGTPVAGAQVVFPESGSGEAVTVDASGKFSWTNLPGAETTLNVTA
jgi:Carboxypeptidase regulatory-like domain